MITSDAINEYAKQHAELEFRDKLEKLISNLRERAESQFKYNLEVNIPEKIGNMTLENAVEQALESAIVGASNQMTEWCCDAAIRRAYAVMEDANCHAEARTLVQFIPEYQ